MWRLGPKMTMLSRTIAGPNMVNKNQNGNTFKTVIDLICASDPRSSL